jgi:hypothetical protein
MPLAPGRPPKKSPTASADVVNRSGAFAGGSTGSGTATYKPKPKTPMNPNQRIQQSVKAKQSGTFLGGVAGSGTVKDQWVGEGADKRYVQVPDPVKGSGGPVPPSYNQTKRNAAAAGIDAGSSRNAPGKPGRAPKKVDVPVGDADAGRPAPTAPKDKKPKEDKASTTTTSTSTSSSGDTEKKTAPAVPGSLNYFMKMTMKDGRKNQRNRAYQMFKNYKKTGKLPSDMGSATQ